jgi:hypothetical protein
VCHGRLGTMIWKICLLGIKKWKILPLGHQEIKNLVSVFHFNLVKCLVWRVDLVVLIRPLSGLESGLGLCLVLIRLLHHISLAFHISLYYFNG